MKYIIINNNGLEMPVVFCEILDHSAVAGCHKVLSAGFCDIGHVDGTWSVWGRSVSLKMESKPEDADFIKRGLELRI